MVRLSKLYIETYLGDVVPLSLEGEGIDIYSSVSWSVFGDAVTIRDFAGEGRYSFANGILVSFVKIGEAKIVCEYNGEKYETVVKCREMNHSSSDDELEFYVADMHSHTSTIHNQIEFAKHEKDDITDLIDFVSNEGLIDGAIISDHADVTNDIDFFRGFVLTENQNAPVIFPGSESEIEYTEYDRLGYRRRHSGEIVTFMSAGYVNCKTYEEYESEIMRSSYPVGIFAHPHVIGHSMRGIWNFDYAMHNTPQMLHIMRGIEMGNGGDSKENLLHEYAYSQALDAGFKVSTTCGSDSHGPVWGYNSLMGKTVILARERTPEAFHDAFLSNRFYATESGNVKVRYSVNGTAAPATLKLTRNYSFHVDIAYFKEDVESEIVTVQVISDGGKVICEHDVMGKSLHFEVCSDTARYFYLRLFDRLGRKTWSMPVWCSREFDKARSYEHLAPIDKSVLKATSRGIDASEVINGDPHNSWESGELLPIVIIDLGEEREISAFGLYPHYVEFQNKPKGFRSREETKSIVTRFKIYVSLDGENYKEVANEQCQNLAWEMVVSFPKTLARYVKFETLGNVGLDSRRPNYADTETKIGEITIFE